LRNGGQSGHGAGPDRGWDHLRNYGGASRPDHAEERACRASNFDNYQMLRINEVPAVEVHIIKSTEAPGGMGEPGTAAVFPAVTNAIFAATGKRLRKLPVDPGELRSV